MDIFLTCSEDEMKKKFFSLKSRRDIAGMLEVDLKDFIYYLYRLPEASNYTVFHLPKRRGGYRIIAAPVTSIKILQKKFNQVLRCVYKKRTPVHGFVEKRSVITNAQAHIAKSLILNIDLKDFFPSLHFGRVSGLFMHYPFNLNKLVADSLAKLCCYDKALPQGAPTSPIISNMICSKLDRQLSKLASEHDCTYTRYADDLTFSTDSNAFHTSVASYSEVGKLELGSGLKDIIKDNSFRINPDKIKMRNKLERQSVTGVTVNEFPNLPRRYVRQIRAMFHAVKRYGIEAAEIEHLAKYNKKHRIDAKIPLSFAKVLKGKIDYLGAVRGKRDSLYLHYRHEFRQCFPKLLTCPETPLEFYVRISRLAHTTTVAKTVEAITDKSERLTAFLAPLGLETIRLGAWTTYYGESPDKYRQASHSMRELLIQLLDILAPDDDVTSAPWYPTSPPEHGVSRKLRIRYILNGNATKLSKSTLNYIDSIANFTEASYQKLCIDAHSRSDFNPEETKLYMDGCEIAILVILLKKS